MKIRTVVAGGMLALLSAATFAQGTSTPRVDDRQARQDHRIDQGRASGELTPREAHRLQREQQAIRHAERHAKADGVVTAAERQRLARMQQAAARHIAHQKHDRQDVWRR